jgi:hypothetical protein
MHNGSMRDLATAPAASDAAPAQRVVPGTLRKCVRGSQTSYVDGLCPPGFKEQAIARGTVTVVAGQRPAAAAPPPKRAPLHEALDYGGGTDLKERRIERIADQ